MTEDNYKEKYDAVKAHTWVPIWVSSIALAAVLALFLVFTVKDANQFGIAIGVLQFLLAITALAGFWTIRDAAISKSKEIAKGVAKEEANEVSSKHLEDNHERQVHDALQLLFDSDRGKSLLVEAMSKPEIVATLVARAQEMGLDLDKPPPTSFTNPGKQPMGPKNLNHLQTGFWKGIGEKELNRFLNKSSEPPFEE